MIQQPAYQSTDQASYLPTNHPPNLPTYQPTNAGLDLSSLLIMPVQRLPRFVLWIETLLQVTPSRFRDAPELKKALALIREVTSYVEAQAHRKQGLYKVRCW